MTRDEFDDIKPRLLGILNEQPPLSPRDLFDKLIEVGELSDSQAMDAIGRLIDDGDIRFSKSRKFEVATPQS